MELGKMILFVTELFGTATFAISGAMVGIEKRLDLLGVMVLGISTAVGGGAVRDLLLGQIPPTMFRKSIYVLLAIAASILAFCIVGMIGDSMKKYRMVYRFLMNFFDAAGLGVFAATSVNLVISLGYEKNMFMAVFMGTVTAVGGGVLRDMMAGKVPLILRKRIYALAAIMGSTVYYLLYFTGLNPMVNMYLSIVLVVIIRLLAAHFEWNLPQAPEVRWMEEKTEEAGSKSGGEQITGDKGQPM